MEYKGMTIGTLSRRIMYAVYSVLLISGIGWMISHYFFAREDLFANSPSSFEPLMLKLHGAAVPVFLLILGSLWPEHIKPSLSARRNLFTGIMISSAMLLLIFTGTYLYYSGDETSRNNASLIHIILGSLSLPIIILHILYGRSIVKEFLRRIK